MQKLICTKPVHYKSAGTPTNKLHRNTQHMFCDVLQWRYIVQYYNRAIAYHCGTALVCILMHTAETVGKLYKIVKFP